MILNFGGDALWERSERVKWMVETDLLAQSAKLTRGEPHVFRTLTRSALANINLSSSTCSQTFNIPYLYFYLLFTHASIQIIKDNCIDVKERLGASHIHSLLFLIASFLDCMSSVPRPCSVWLRLFC